MSPTTAEGSHRGGRPTAAAVACLALITLVLTGPSMAGRAALAPEQLLDWDPLYRVGAPPPFPIADDHSPVVLDYPRDLAFARGLHEGRIDLWNPLVSCGAPLSTEHGGFFFPLKIPFYLAPSRFTYNLFLALRLFVAGLGSYLLARRRGLADVPAIAAGAVYQMAGAAIWALPFASTSALYLLPWALLGALAIAESTTTAAVVGSALVLGVAGNSGHAPMMLLVFVSFGLATAVHVAARWRHPRKAAAIAAWAAVASLLGLLLAAPSLLPLAELSSLASGYKTRPVAKLMRTWKLIEARQSLTAAFGSRLLGTAPSSGALSSIGPAIGAFGFSVAAVGLLGMRREGALLAVAGLGVTLALAPPGLRWIYRLPVLNLIIPTYAWPLVLAPLAQAAGDGVRTLCRQRGVRVGLIAVAALAALSWIFSEIVAVSSPGGLLRRPPPVALSTWSLLAPPVAAALVVAVCVALRRTRFAFLCPAVLTAMIVVDLLTTMIPFTRHPTSDVFFGPPSPAVRFLQSRLADGEGRMLALPFLVGFPHTPMVFGLPDVRGTGPLPIRRYYDYRHAISPKAGDFTLHDVPVVRSPLLDLAAVRYVVLPASLSPEEAILLTPPAHPDENDPTIAPVYRDEHVVVYENQAAVPRVRIVHRSTTVPSRDAARKWAATIGTKAGHAGNLGLRHAVVLEPDGDGNRPRELAARDSPGEYARIVDQSDPDVLRLEAHLTEPGFVVVADAYYRGWKAWVDGRPTRIYPADLLFRAVVVEPGTHRIVMRYRPASFRGGMILFAVGLLGCSYLIARRRRAASRPAWS